MTTILIMSCLEQTFPRTSLLRKTTLSKLTIFLCYRGLAIQGEKCLLLDKASRYGGHLSNFNLMHYFDYGKSDES